MKMSTNSLNSILQRVQKITSALVQKILTEAAEKTIKIYKNHTRD